MTFPRPLLEVGSIRQAGLGIEAPELDDSAVMHESVVAVVVGVYPIGHPENTYGQMLVDVQPIHQHAVWKKIPVATGYAHGETAKAVPNSRRRQPYDPKPRNQMEGVSYDLRPGTRVKIGYPSGDRYAPMVIGCLKFMQQGSQEAPVEQMGADYVDDTGHFAMRAVRPLDSDMETYPRARDFFNGSGFERDNRGNIHFQTTTDRDPVFPGHNDVPKSPAPQGNFSVSTRGAAMGRQGRVTGKHPITGEAGDGSIRDETIDATNGCYIARLRSKKGRYWVSTRGSDDGRVYLEDKERSYVAMRANGVADLYGAQKAVMNAAKVCLGNDDPQYHAILWEKLNEWMDLMIQFYDAHTHTEVQTGDGTSGPPSIGIRTFWQTLYLSGDAYKSDNVKLVKAEGPTPHHESDPDGGDDPVPEPPPPPAKPVPKPKRRGVGGGAYGVFGSGANSGGGGRN